MLLCYGLALDGTAILGLCQLLLALGCSSVLDDCSVREAGRGWDELTGLADYFSLLALLARDGAFSCHTCALACGIAANKLALQIVDSHI